MNYFRGDIMTETNGYSRLPTQLLHDLAAHKLDGHSVALFWVLCLDVAGTGKAYSELGQQRLAAMLSLSESTVGRSISQLANGGYLNVKRIGLGQPSRLFTLTDGGTNV
jgi:hypothetical protein